MIRAVLTNRRTYFRCLPSEQLRLREFFRYFVPGAQYSEKYQSGAWDGYLYLMRRGVVSTGLFLAQRSAIEAKLGPIVIDDRRRFPKFRDTFPDVVESRIRDYQRQCVQAMIRASNTGGIVLNCTGSGKTFLAGAFLSRLVGKACFIVDELTLLEQARHELGQCLVGERVGIIGAGIFQPERVTVATVQTLHKRRHSQQFQQWCKDLQVVIFDEVHLALNRRSTDLFDTIQPLAVYGLTATLELDKDHIRMPAAALAGPVIYTYPIEQGVREGYIAPGVVCQLLFPEYGFRGNYERLYYHLISHNERRNRCIELLAREAIKRKLPTIILAERIQHLQELSRRLADVRHELLTGQRPKDERYVAKVAMDQGQLPLILASKIFAKGIDIRVVTVIINAGAGRSESGAIQRYGRGTRRAAGKLGLIYVDVMDHSPVGKTDPRYNPFQVHTDSRIKAYKKLGMPVFAMVWTGDAGKVIDHAMQRLEGSSLGEYGMEASPV